MDKKQKRSIHVMPSWPVLADSQFCESHCGRTSPRYTQDASREGRVQSKPERSPRQLYA